MTLSWNEMKKKNRFFYPRQQQRSEPTITVIFFAFDDAHLKKGRKNGKDDAMRCLLVVWINLQRTPDA